MKSRLALVTILVSLFALPSFAQSNEFGISYAASRIHKTDDADGRVKFDNGSGYGLSFNHYWTDHIATQLAYTRTSGDGTIAVSGTPVLDIGTLRLKIVTLAGQWHFLRKQMLDPYLGLGYSLIGASELASADLALAGTNHIHLRDDSGVVYNAGVNVNIAPHWGAAIDAKHLRYSPDATSGSKSVGRLKLSPTIFTAGVRLRF